MNDAKLSKGKAREDSHWQLGWWELLPLADGSKRSPVAWTRSSVIYTAHPSQPVVLGRHFPSSRQFVVPTPSLFIDNTASYDPPTVISISPAEDWLFAYFPGRGCDGVGYLWKRASQLDCWFVQEKLNYAPGAGVVTAEWTSTERPWVVGEHGPPFRLPSRGPHIPMHAPTLLLVTQTHEFHACFLPPVASPVRVVKCSLQQLATAQDRAGRQEPAATQDKGKASGSEDATEHSGGKRLCTHATIGLGYNEQFIMVATRSQLLPATPSNQPPFSSMDLGIALDITTSPPPESSTATDWQQLGEDPSIEICTVTLFYNAIQIGIRTMPMSPIFLPRTQLTDLRFFAVPPEIIPPSPTITRDPRRPVKDSGVSEKGTLYLTVTSLEFEDYSSLPKSKLSLYTITRGNSPESPWHHRLEQTRIFDTSTLTFLAPFTSRTGIVAGFIDPAGTIPRQSGKAKEVRVGSMSVLTLPDLKTDERWEDSHILAAADVAGREVPTSIAVSPNSAFICCISPSPMHASRTSVHPAPHRRIASQPAPTSTAPRNDMARALISAILTRRSPSDVIHSLSSSTVSFETVAITLLQALSTLEAYPYGLSSMWQEELLGVVTEVYLARSRSETNDAAKEALAEQSKTAHDLCSVIALNGAFEECQERDNYDVEAIWQLVGLCRWLIGLLEKLLKQCVYVGEYDPLPGTPGRVKPEVEADPLRDPAVLLHLVHPFALRNLQEAVTHVKRFRDELDPLPPKGENSQIAKDILMDTVDSSGINLTALLSVLEEIKALSKTSVEDLRKSLLTCMLAPSSRMIVRDVTEKILKAGILDRPKLFIKPSELVDGVSRISFADRLKERESDVVSKGLLLNRGAHIVCVRCGGKSEIGGEGKIAGHISFKWRAWELTWASRCICGGAWMRVM